MSDQRTPCPSYILWGHGRRRPCGADLGGGSHCVHRRILAIGRIHGRAQQLRRRIGAGRQHLMAGHRRRYSCAAGRHSRTHHHGRHRSSLGTPDRRRHILLYTKKAVAQTGGKCACFRRMLCSDDDRLQCAVEILCMEQPDTGRLHIMGVHGLSGTSRQGFHNHYAAGHVHDRCKRVLPTVCTPSRGLRP